MAVDGEPATLECQLQAPPGAIVKWYKDDKLVPASKDFEQTFDGSTAKFIIGEVFPDDDGCYMCAVETPGGYIRIETSANISVQGERFITSVKTLACYELRQSFP